MKNPCSTITDMALPDEVVQAALSAQGAWATETQMKAAIRAALQAMLDSGMAYEHYDGANAPVLSIKIRRLDADERKPALQEERK